MTAQEKTDAIIAANVAKLVAAGKTEAQAQRIAERLAAMSKPQTDD